MSISNYLTSGFILKKARELAAVAHLAEADKADPLFQKAYEAFACYSSSRAGYADCLHSWGLALVNQAQNKTGDNALKVLDQAMMKFNLCDTLKPNHIGASLDNGVAMMTVAKIKYSHPNDDWYVNAKKSFLKAETIQQDSAAYNLACLYAIQGKTDDCLKSLEKARNCGLIPDEQAILNDADLNNVKQLSWFDEFISSLTIEEPVEEIKFNPYK